MGKQLTPPNSALRSDSLRSNKSTEHCNCNPVATASFHLAVHRADGPQSAPGALWQSTFCSLSQHSGRHNHQADPLYSNLPLAPLPIDSPIEGSLVPLAPRLANSYTIGACRARLVHAPRSLNESINVNYYCTTTSSPAALSVSCTQFNITNYEAPYV